MGKCLFMRKGEVHTNPGAGRLPFGYLALAYIESSGTQYIDTGFKPNQDSRIVFDFALNPYDTSRPLFGTRDAAAKNAFCAFANTGNVYQQDYANAQTTGLGTMNYERCIIDANKTQFFVAGNLLNTQTYTDFACSYSAYLFAVNNGGNLHNNGCTAGKLYSCQVYDNDVLVRDFVPCANNVGEIGLYDFVTKTFYGNAGSGTFVGSEVA